MDEFSQFDALKVASSPVNFNIRLITELPLVGKPFPILRFMLPPRFLLSCWSKGVIGQDQNSP